MRVAERALELLLLEGGGHIPQEQIVRKAYLQVEKTVVHVSPVVVVVVDEEVKEELSLV